MNHTYFFSVLRYCYDPLTEEFVNIGVVVYSVEKRYLRALITPNYGRASKFFLRIDGTRFRQFSRFIEDQIDAAGRYLENSLALEDPKPLETILSRVLPPDDSAFSFGKVRGGISTELGKTLRGLFDRYVESYTRVNEEGRRTEDDVWRTFRDQFDKRLITSRLAPKKIVSRDYEYDFQHAWKNGVWNLYEPISFDLLDASSMLEKANKWVGRAFALEQSSEPFQLNFLLGAPQDPKLREAYFKAENLLNRMQVKHQFIKEDEAVSFAQELEIAIKSPH